MASTTPKLQLVTFAGGDNMPIAFDINMDANWLALDDTFIVNTVQTKTWNDPTRTFRGLGLNVTDTTSASASLLMDLQVASSSKFKVDKAGVIYKAGVQLVMPQMITVFNAFASGLTRYTSANGNYNATESVVAFPMTMACTVGNLYFITSNSQSGTGSLVCTVRKNSASSTIVATVAAGGAGQVASDTTHTSAFSAGDTFDVMIVNNASATSAQITGISWTVTVG